MLTRPVPRSALLVAALVLPLGVAAALSGFRSAVSTANGVLVLVLVVVAVAAGGSRLAGVVGALSSVAWFDFFLTKPYYSFTIAGRDDVETAVLLILVGLSVTEIVLWGRREQARSSRREGYLTGVTSAAALVAEGTADRRTVLDFVSRQIVEVLDIDRCEYVAGPPVSRPRLRADGVVTRDGRDLDVERSGLPTHDVVEVPVTLAGRVLGRFVLTAT
jgi:K+-sensing histidine kinase KdpD